MFAATSALKTFAEGASVFGRRGDSGYLGSWHCECCNSCNVWCYVVVGGRCVVGVEEVLDWIKRNTHAPVVKHVRIPPMEQNRLEL